MFDIQGKGLFCTAGGFSLPWARFGSSWLLYGKRMQRQLPRSLGPSLHPGYSVVTSLKLDVAVYLAMDLTVPYRSPLGIWCNRLHARVARLEIDEVDAICADVGKQQRHSMIGVQDILSPNEKRFHIISTVSRNRE